MPCPVFLYAANMLPLFSRWLGMAFNENMSVNRHMTPPIYWLFEYQRGVEQSPTRQCFVSVLSLPGPVGRL